MLEAPEAVTAAMLGFLQPPDADLDALGARVRAEVLGADHVARAAAATTALDRDFQAYITRVAWGSVWARPHFDRRTRQHHHAQLARRARPRPRARAPHPRDEHTGATHADLTELLLHVAVYAGVPAANTRCASPRQLVEEAP